MTQPRLPLRTRWALGFRRKSCSWVRLLDLGEHRREFSLEPGMQDHIGGREDAFGVENASRRAKERQQFGGAPALILMGVQERMAFGLPRGPRLRDGLVRPRFIFVQLHNPRRFRLLA